jgi:hypothetical protein
MRICTFPGCGREHCARGLCNTHYRQQRETGNLRPIRPVLNSHDETLRCQFDGCERDQYSRGYCSGHYQQNKTGSLHSLPDIEDEVSYIGVHMRCRRLWGPAHLFPCVQCGDQAKHWAYDGTDPAALQGIVASAKTPLTWSRYPEFYMPLCVSCHRCYDLQLQEFNRKVVQ